MFDEKGRLWYTARLRPADNPAYCKAGSSLPSAKLTPADRSGRQLGMYDPKTKQSYMIDTCFATHHLLFAEDANNTLWTSTGGGGGVVGWLNTKMWDQTHDEQKSQGWTALVLDTNGNGKRDPYQESEQNVVTAPSGESLGISAILKPSTDPSKDTRLNAAFYGLAIGTDGMIWGSVLGFPGGIVRLNPGSNPPETALAEYYEVPWNNPKAPVSGFSPRGMDIDRNSVAWVALGSGHLASFDRRKCKGPLNGPKATGQHCPEGWTLYPTPGPNFKNVKDSGSADSHYYDWVDQFDTLGLGQEHAHHHRQLFRFADRLGQRQVGHHARALSARIFRQRDGRPHRRRQRRAGKARASGPPGARARRSTARPEKAPCPRWFTSRSGPTRSRIEGIDGGIDGCGLVLRRFSTRPDLNRVRSEFVAAFFGVNYHAISHLEICLLDGLAPAREGGLGAERDFHRLSGRSSHRDRAVRDLGDCTHDVFEPAMGEYKSGAEREAKREFSERAVLIHWI